MAKTKGQIKMTNEQKEAFDKVLRRRSIKKDQKGFDGVVSMRRHQNKVIVPEKKLEDRLWEAADHMRANSALRLNEFAEPVLGLIFLKFTGVKFSKTEKEISAERKAKTKNYGGASVARERPVSSADYHAQGTLYVPEKARFSYLIELPEGTDMGKAVNDAMKEIEAENKELAGILPKSFQMLENRSIITLLKNFNQIPDDIEGDAFGRIYEYFLGKFAIADGSGGGEFFTPSSIVKLIVEILEPFKGYIYDPACGSGGMFVQSVEFIKRHFENGKKAKASREVSIYGQEKTDQTVRIAKMNLAIHGLSGDIRQGNTYYEDLHRSVGKFDFAMANPPFNVNGIDKERIKDDPRFLYGIPRNDNGNYLWIQIFLSALKNTGRAGFVMANSASDAGHSEKEIRTKMIDDDLVDVMVAVGPNMFYNVTLPVTLWFLDKGKKKTDRKNKILFIDARNIYRQIDRAHRDWTNEQIEQIASIASSYRGENGKKYQNVKGLCRVATIDEVKKAGYSLNPGRYVGVTDNGNGDERNFGEKIKKLHSELKDLTSEAHELENKIFENLNELDI
jgi:type I restriction enzyme M protein